ncbi:GGDEF domain-containing protein [Pseudooctadecabacter sp.]|uniref:GGDEF domain-containing protein n=1 Tax=Pseudooctadecabacter sp. TaxID=1966338 RepID=UPI0035C83122
MNQSKSTIKRIPNRIRFTLAAMGFGVLAVIVVMVVWMTDIMDDLAHEYAAELVELSLFEKTSKTVAATRDEARWGAGDRWVLAPNGLAIYGDVGAATTTSAAIDYSYIFGKDDRLLYVFESQTEGLPPQSQAFESASPFVSAVRDLPAISGDVIAGFTRIDTTLAFVAATRMNPQNRADFARADLPIVVNIFVLGPDVLDLINQGQLAQNVELSFTPAQHGSEIALPLFGTDTFAYLFWTPPQIGDEVLNRSTKFIAFLLVIVSLGHFYVSHTVSRLARAFQRESEDARTDGLTGLLNRTGFDEAMESREIADAMAAGHLGVMIFDMDRFKPINDTYGHHVGDVALQTVAHRLKSSARTRDLVARLGGDEFAAVVIDPDPERVVRKVMRRLEQANLAPIKVEGNILTLAASMGFALAKDASDLRQLMMAADASMYAAKTARAYREDVEDIEDNVA